MSMSQIMMASICLHTCWRFIRSRIAYFTCSPAAVKSVLKIDISNIRTYDRIRKEKGSLGKIQLNLNNTTASLVWVYLAMFGGEFLGSWPVFQRVPGVQENCDQLPPELDNDLELSSFGHEHVVSAACRDIWIQRVQAQQLYRHISDVGVLKRAPS